MEDTRQCRSCGAEMPAGGSPEGLCSKCLLRQALNHGAEGNAATKRVSENAPAIEELAPEFPQLEIMELIGVGGMGAVYRARQRNLDRIVALKIVSGKVHDDPSFAERFSREARALAKLNHPNIVAVYDFGQAPGGRYYFIMEFVDGVNLRDTIRSGRLVPEEALAIVPRICDALQYAHDEGVVHRDIKPENILVDLKGRVKIADFGLAKLIAPGAQDFTLTGTRDIMGTPHYMAPEQIDRPLQVDHRADIYALGVVLYEMLTGELPLGRFAPPSHKVHVDVRLDEIVLRTLEREPERRYQQASQLKTDVESVSRPDNSPGAAALRTVNDLATAEKSRSKLLVPAIGLILAALINVVVFIPFLVNMVGGHVEIQRTVGNSTFGFTDKGSPVFAIWSAIVAVVLITGALNMLSLQSRRSAMLACIVGMLPLHIGVILGFPFGLLGLLRLTRPGMFAAFAPATEQGVRWLYPLNKTFGHAGEDPTAQRISSFMGGLIALVAVMIPIVMILQVDWKGFINRIEDKGRAKFLTERPPESGVIIPEPVIIEPIKWEGTVGTKTIETETSGPNLLLNPGFEESAADDPRRPMHWTSFSDFPSNQTHAVRAIEGGPMNDLLPRVPGVLATEYMRPYAGAAAGLLTVLSHDRGPKAGLLQELPGVTGGDTLIVAGYVKGTALQWGAAFGIETRNRDDMTTQLFTAHSLSGTWNDWLLKSTIVRIPENSTASLVLLMGGPGATMFDELLVKKAEEPLDPASLLLNGGFEYIAHGEVVGWEHNTPPRSEGSLKPDTKERHGGRSSLTVARTTSGSAPVGWRHYLKDVPAGGMRKLTGFVKLTPGSTAIVRAVVLDTKSGTSMPFAKSVHADGEYWQRVELTCLIPQNKPAWIDLSLIGEGQAWFDDFRLE